MNDVFKEQIVKQRPTTKDAIIKSGYLGVAFVVIYLTLTIQFLFNFMLPVLVALGFGMHALFKMLAREYEYILTNGELDVDCIYGKSRRKRIFSGDLKGFEMMVQLGDDGYEDVFKKAVVSKDCSDGKASENTYKFVAPYKGKMMCIRFSPNEEMLRLMTPYLGQKRLALKK